VHEQHKYQSDISIFCRSVKWGSPFLVLRTEIRAMLEQHAYDFDLSNRRRHVQWGREVFGPRVYICTLLEQHAYNFDAFYVPRGRAVVGPRVYVCVVLVTVWLCDTPCRFVQWGSPFLVLRTNIHAMFEQHAYDLCVSIRRRYVQRGRAAILSAYVGAMLEQQAYESDTPFFGRSGV